MISSGTINMAPRDEDPMMFSNTVPQDNKDSPSPTVTKFQEKRLQLTDRRNSIRRGLKALSERKLTDTKHNSPPRAPVRALSDERSLTKEFPPTPLVAENNNDTTSSATPSTIAETVEPEQPDCSVTCSSTEPSPAPQPSGCFSIESRHQAPNQVEVSLAALRTQRETLEITCRAFGEGLSALLDGHDQQLASVGKRAAAAEAEVQKWKDQAVQATRRATAAHDELAQLRAQLAQMQQALQAKDQETVALQEQVEELKSDQTTLQETVQALQTDVASRDETMHALTDKLSQQTEEVASWANQNRELEAELVATRQKVKLQEQQTPPLVHSPKARPSLPQSCHAIVSAFPVWDEGDPSADAPQEVDDELFYFD